MKEHSRFQKEKMKKGIYVLPNLFTTASLFAGFYSMIASMKGLFEVAAVAILVAAVLDALDGRIARMTNTTSKFGAEYDSLADLVSFGVAPALLAYTWSLQDFGRWGWVVSFLFVTCGALRLARFNIQIGIIDSRVFNGLPIPGAAAVVATGVLIYYKLGGVGHFHHPLVLISVFILALFMVSNIKYYSFKDLNFFAKKPFMSFVVIVCILVVVIAEPQIMIFTFVAGYSLSGPIWLIVKLYRKGTSAATEKKSAAVKTGPQSSH
ncbi:MAG TPA: CDP-diacylglycerol--serine O-phosphatidyltransferase [Syntrophales bacterium]|jgi:CDP-diacylglycerol--serine O-phosphatidyltransferase|nr:CDP-diacylglycerol--serine O-phosphatidyltransferase [Syntrophales bacterium]HOD97760.1 CDP-diacylglycerol--serine O-phosphatidyltransferase [Syntrophales bacterium]HOH73041.1 CDP-diacylglycerol--serine O-phosphatidyltransferase [Syntrophales bacterium]HPN09061.1 CDP-diacylglycerol--serine O-phosphatidyltransferase [Syntrophales bacterium]HPX80492.1 CDP-diacylglycerol--serine O-phosphatidyltransferase [Syntrophales bacterium]